MEEAVGSNSGLAFEDLPPPIRANFCTFVSSKNAYNPQDDVPAGLVCMALAVDPFWLLQADDTLKETSNGSTEVMRTLYSSPTTIPFIAIAVNSF